MDGAARGRRCSASPLSRSASAPPRSRTPAPRATRRPWSSAPALRGRRSAAPRRLARHRGGAAGDGAAGRRVPTGVALLADRPGLLGRAAATRAGGGSPASSRSSRRSRGRTALPHGFAALVPALLLPAAAWGAGRALRERELVAAQLAERVRELEEEREAHAALSVRYERARIASELHDIVAHAISVMVIQASAGPAAGRARPRGYGGDLRRDRRRRPPGRAGHGSPRRAARRRGARSAPRRTWRWSRSSSPARRAAAST